MSSVMVSAALKIVAGEENDPCLQTTPIFFLQHMHKWFNLMASLHPLMALSKLNNEKYFKAVIFLEKIVQLFKNIKIVDKNDKIIWKPTQTRIIISMLSI